MSVYFEELDFRPTAMGVLSLRRRRHLTTGVDIYEIKYLAEVVTGLSPRSPEDVSPSRRLDRNGERVITKVVAGTGFEPVTFRL